MCFHRPRLKQRTKLMHSPLSSSPSPSFPCPSSELCLKTKLAESVSGDDNTAGNAPKTYQTLVTEIKLWDTKQHPLTHNNNQQKQTPPQKKTPKQERWPNAYYRDKTLGHKPPPPPNKNNNKQTKNDQWEQIPPQQNQKVTKWSPQPNSPSSTTRKIISWKLDFNAHWAMQGLHRRSSSKQEQNVMQHNGCVLSSGFLCPT